MQKTHIIVLVTAVLASTALSFVLFGDKGLLKGVTAPVEKAVPASAPNFDASALLSQAKSCLIDGAAWLQTVKDPQNSSLKCLGGEGLCEHSKGGNFRPRGGTGQDFCFPGYDPLQDAQLGLTPDGKACQGFGGAACPMRLEFSWTALCPSSLPKCSAPVIEISIDLLQAGKRMRESFSQPHSLKTDGEFLLVEQRDKGKGGGACKNGWTTRKFNIVVHNTENYLAGMDQNNGFLQLRPGIYDCTISAPAYGVGFHQLALMDIGEKQSVGLGTNAYSGQPSAPAMSRSEMHTRFTLEKDSVLGLYHFCELPQKTKKASDRDLGAPIGQFPELYASLRCLIK